MIIKGKKATAAKKSARDETRYRAPALDKGIDILELLASVPYSKTKAEIATALGRSQSEIYRMLERLVARGYVLKIETDRYSLSMHMFTMATRYPPIQRLVNAAAPLMARFSKAVFQSCHLGRHDNGSMVILAQQASPSDWGMQLRLGAKIDLASSASGRLFMAFQPAEVLQSITTNYHVQLDNKFLTELKDIRRIGHLTAPSRQAKGVLDISFPIIDGSGEAIAVLTCPFVERLDGLTAKSLEQTIYELGAIASELSFGAR